MYLIHVIPNANVLSTINPRKFAVLRFGRLEQTLPPLPALWVEEIDPGTAPGPAPTLKLALTVWLFDEDIKFGGLVVDWIA